MGFAAKLSATFSIHSFIYPFCILMNVSYSLHDTSGKCPLTSYPSIVLAHSSLFKLSCLPLSAFLIVFNPRSRRHLQPLVFVTE